MIKISIMFLIFWVWQNFPVMYGHRSVVHRQFVFHPWLVDFINIIKWTQTFKYCAKWPTLWISGHLKHHIVKFTDTKNDPHTPLHYSFWNIVNGTAGIPITAKEEELYNKSYNFTPSKLSRHLEKIKGGPCVMLGILLYAFSWPGIILWILCLLANMQITGFFNYIAHTPIGYRNGPRRGNDQSVNLPMFFCLIFGGEELHENHHRCPNRANHAMRWWEIDIGYQLLKILSWIGLVKFNR